MNATYLHFHAFNPFSILNLQRDIQQLSRGATVNIKLL